MIMLSRYLSLAKIITKFETAKIMNIIGSLRAHKFVFPEKVS